ncbi:MAG: hypothetical protein WBA67_12505 [Jannaschia sp.]
MSHRFTKTRAGSVRARLSDFSRRDRGAVTVDMMPLMAVAVVLGLAVTGLILTGLSNQSENIATAVANTDRTDANGTPVFGSLGRLSVSGVPAGSGDTASSGGAGAAPDASGEPVPSAPVVADAGGPSDSGESPASGDREVVRISARVGAAPGTR